MPQRDLLSHHPAHEDTEQIGLRNLQGVEQPDHIVGEHRGGKLSTGIIGSADAAMIEDDRSPSLRELGDLERQPPLAGATGSHHEHEGRPRMLPVALIIDLPTRYDDVRHARILPPIRNHRKRSEAGTLVGWLAGVGGNRSAATPQLNNSTNVPGS